MTTRRKKTPEEAKDEEAGSGVPPEDSAPDTGEATESPEAADASEAASQSGEPESAGAAPASESGAATAAFEELPDAGGEQADPRNLSLVMEIPVTCSVELGRSRIRIAELLKLSRGSVIEVDRPAGDPLDLRVNGCLVARGEVVVVNEKFGIRLLDIVDRAERLKSVS